MASIIYAAEYKNNYPASRWQILVFKDRLREAQVFIELREQSYPNAKHRVVKYKRERIYK